MPCIQQHIIVGELRKRASIARDVEAGARHRAAVTRPRQSSRVTEGLA
jgi:hypothetical protein